VLGVAAFALPSAAYLLKAAIAFVRPITSLSFTDENTPPVAHAESLNGAASTSDPSAMKKNMSLGLVLLYSLIFSRNCTMSSPGLPSERKTNIRLHLLP